MRNDFGLHFGVWLLFSTTFVLLVFGFLFRPVQTNHTPPAQAFFYGLAGVLVFSFICSLIDFFVVSAIVRFVKTRWR